MATEVVFTRAFQKDVSVQRVLFEQYRTKAAFRSLSKEVLRKAYLLRNNPYLGTGTEVETVRSLGDLFYCFKFYLKADAFLADEVKN